MLSPIVRVEEEGLYATMDWVQSSMHRSIRSDVVVDLLDEAAVEKENIVLGCEMEWQGLSIYHVFINGDSIDCPSSLESAVTYFFAAPGRSFT